MRPFSSMLVLAIGGLLFLPQAANAATSSGLDTVNGNQIFAVEGTKVGEWGPGELNVTGGVVASGAVQVGQTTANCSADNEGALRYKKSSKQIEFCNGTTWTITSGGTSGSWCGAYVQAGSFSSIPSAVVKNCSGATVSFHSGATLLKIDCPAGYSLTDITAGLGVLIIEKSGGSQGGSTDFRGYSILTCMKD